MIEDLLAPLRDDPKHSAVLLDVDGVLAPIVAQPDDAHMPETTRRPLIEVAKRYGVVACVSGRRASDARRIVSLGSIAYLGSHGSEVLRPGAIAPEVDRELAAWTRRVLSGMCASSGCWTIGARTPSTSSRIADRFGSAFSGCSRSSRVPVGPGTPTSMPPDAEGADKRRRLGGCVRPRSR